jgi:hypothetical protein
MTEKFKVKLEVLVAMFLETILGDEAQRSLIEECQSFRENRFLSCYNIYHDYGSSRFFPSASSHLLAT